MMRKIGIGIFCVAFCLAVAFIFPQLGKTYQEVTTGGCIAEGCHSLTDENPVHDANHGYPTEDCTICHVVIGDTPAASKCLECHPADSSEKCDLVDHHESSPNYDPTVSCIVCHPECEVEPTTTTTAEETSTTTSEEGEGPECFLLKVYGEDSEEVEILRYIRDNVLSETPAGQEIIRLYYQLSPVIAIAVRNNEEFREEVKETVDGFLGLIVEDAE